MITNNFNFPTAIVNAVKNDPYDSGDCDISVTRLIKPPQQVSLTAKHSHELPDEDVSDRIWSLLGQASHTILERAAGEDAVVEQRWFAECDGWTISGQIDLLENHSLDDFKVTSVWAVKDALAHGKPEWEAQLNVLKWLYDGQPSVEDDDSIDELRIIAICRDWRRNEALRYDDYPKQSEVISVPMWTDAERQAFVEKKVSEHKAAREGNSRPCTDTERWRRDTKYAIMKKGRKSAVRVLDSMSDAEKYIETENPKGEITIDIRKGEFVMCNEFCSAAPFCQQHQDDN